MADPIADPVWQANLTDYTTPTQMGGAMNTLVTTIVELQEKVVNLQGDDDFLLFLAGEAQDDLNTIIRNDASMTKKLYYYYDKMIKEMIKLDGISTTKSAVNDIKTLLSKVIKK